MPVRHIGKAHSDTRFGLSFRHLPDVGADAQLGVLGRHAHANHPPDAVLDDCLIDLPDIRMPVPEPHVDFEAGGAGGIQTSLQPAGDFFRDLQNRGLAPVARYRSVIAWTSSGAV